jgi:hypothetical protein
MPPGGWVTTPVKTIAIVPAMAPQEYEIENTSALSFVALPALLAYHSSSNAKTELFNQKSKDGREKLAADLNQCIALALQSDGYQTEVLTDLRRPVKDPDDVDLKKIQTPADVVLQVKFEEVGLYSSHFSKVYLPRVNITGRVVAMNRHDQQPFNDDVQYGVDASAGSDTQIVADRQFAYPDFDSVMADTAAIQKVFETGTAKVCEAMSAKIMEGLKQAR